MFKKISLILIAGIFFLAISRLSYAMMCGGHAQHQQIAQAESSEHQHMGSEATSATEKEAVNVGNKICPVSGEKINEKLKATHEYKGKIYNFCCVKCVEDFKKDPEAYIKKIEQEKQKEEAGEKIEEPSVMHEHGEHESMRY